MVCKKPCMFFSLAFTISAVDITTSPSLLSVVCLLSVISAPWLHMALCCVAQEPVYSNVPHLGNYSWVEDTKWLSVRLNVVQNK